MSAARDGSGGWLSLGWIVSYPLFAVLGAVIFLSAEEIVQPSRPAVVAAPVLIDSPEWSAGFAARVETLNGAVMGSAVGAVVAKEEPQGAGTLRWTYRLVEVTIDKNRRAEIEAALELLRAIDPAVSLLSENTFNGSQVLVGLDGLLTHTVRIYWSNEPARPRVLLVITSMGDDLRLAREVLEIDPPVAVAVRPFRPFSAQVAELGKILKRDVFLDWSSADERVGLEAALATVPGAVGVAMQGADPNDELVAELRERGLFAVVANGAAQKPCVVSVPMNTEMGEALENLTRQAKDGGRAIGVAIAVGSDEVKVFRDLLSRWRREEVDVVGVSGFFLKPEQPAT